MNYTTRPPAHSWEDTLPPLPPLLRSFAFSFSASFALQPLLLVFNPFFFLSPPNNPILSPSCLHLRRILSLAAWRDWAGREDGGVNRDYQRGAAVR